MRHACCTLSPSLVRCPLSLSRTGSASRVTRLAHWHPLRCGTFVPPAPLVCLCSCTQNPSSGPGKTPRSTAWFKKKNASFHCLSTCLTILICCANICFWKIKGPSTPFRPIVVEDLIHLSKGRKHTHHSKFEIRTSPVSCWILFFLPPPRVFSLLFGLPSRTSERRSCRRGALGFSGTSPVSTALKGAWGGRLARW